VSPANDRPKLPQTFEQWVRWRISRAPSKSLAARTAQEPPQYLKLEEDERCHVFERGTVVIDTEPFVKAELRRMRDAGVIACTNGRWWLRKKKRGSA
jgi:hypothetical protein